MSIFLDADLPRLRAEALQSKSPLYVDESEAPKSTVTNLCVDKGCVHAADLILQGMDEKVNPCDDFYHFACGSFVKNTYIPDEKVTVDSFSIVRDKLQEQTQTIISEDSLPGESKPFTLAKNLYQSCLNKSIIAERGLQPLNDRIKKYGGWPAVDGDNWNEAGWDWKNLIKQFRDDGMEDDPIFSFTVGTNLTNSSARTIDVSLF